MPRLDRLLYQTKEFEGTLGVIETVESAQSRGSSLNIQPAQQRAPQQTAGFRDGPIIEVRHVYVIKRQTRALLRLRGTIGGDAL